jgi:small subunit ribosomal protein S1
MTAKSNRSQEPGLSFSLDDFARALDQHNYEFSKGQIVRGTVVEHSSDGAYVDIGGKSPGYVPIREASVKSDISLAESLPIGEEAEFLIISEQNEDGQVTLSRRQLLLKKAWDNVAEMAESGKSVQMRVSGVNKGGVTGEVEGLRGFIPRSHLIEKENLESLVGQLLTATFLEVDADNKKLVLSQRQAARAAAIGKLEPGALMDGTVVRMQPYGAFVDLDGVTGLLHVKQVSGVPVHSLTTVFEIGQQIKVIVLEIDEYKNRVSLSTKVLESYPGEILEKFGEVMANASERAEQAREQLLSENR